ncbi:MAG TPA: LON peptidase substrate-binding domain-containing protein [Gemmatimonadaceae bacterium]|nr:LON peptidase substrate-binding domain-containing protein [Gemmatimonadaceae bacterium]
MDARLLPLFPLPVVLFPGTARPLHIFEPRYRRMLADCLEGDRRFGLLFCADTEHERALPPGQVGCVARIETADPLPDGRSNIIVAGEDRFALARFVESDSPYLVGEIVDYVDEPELDAELDPLADSVRTAFERLVLAVRAIADQRAPVPELPHDPSRIAYHVASVIDTPVTARYELLRSRSALARLRAVATILEQAVPAVERRAAQHQRARTNGSGHDTAGHAS